MRTRYSMIEVLFAVTISGVLAAMGIGAYVRRVSDAQVFNLTQSLVNKINGCRRMAADSGRQCLVGFPLVDSRIDGADYSPSEFLAGYPAFITAGMTLAPHLATSYPGSIVKVAMGYNPFVSMSTGLRCWDFLPHDPLGRTCAAGDPTSAYEISGSLPLDPGGGDSQQIGHVSIIGFGGAANTTTLNDDLSVAPSYSSYARYGIAFTPDGRLANPQDDLDCASEIHVWVADWHAWREDGTKNFMEIAVSRTGKVSMRSADGASVDPYDPSALGNRTLNACVN